MQKNDAASWPGLKISIDMGGGGSLARELGVSLPQKSVELSWSGAQIEALMRMMGWEQVESKEAERAIWALEDMCSRAIEDCAWLSGHSVGESFDLRKQFELCAPWWRKGLGGEDASDGGSSSVRARSRLILEKDRSGGGTGHSRAFDGALLLALRNERFERFVSTTLDLFGRLGCIPSLESPRRASGAPLEASALPDWSWPARGAALGIELEDGSAVCARVSPAGTRALAASPFGKAFGPRSGFGLLSSSRPLRLVLSTGMATRGYRRCALPSSPAEHFPYVSWSARGSWRDEKEASFDEMESALRALGLGPRAFVEISATPAMPRHASGLVDAAAASWLASLEARMQADKLSRSVKKPGPGSRRRL